MLLSNLTQWVGSSLSEKEAIKIIADAGFDAYDISLFELSRDENHFFNGDDYREKAKELREYADSLGLVCNQSHAPFPTSCAAIRSYYKRAIECTAEAGGKICIIHPDNNKCAEENAQMYLDLLPFAKGCGVKIATENMWNWNDEKDEAAPAACSDPASFNAHLDAVDDDFFVACLDIGHAEMRGLGTTAVEMIKALGPRLQALHIHDNDLWHDSHQIPMSMGIDFEAVVKALKEINYKGYFTLESDRYLNGYTPENILDGLKNLVDADKKLVLMFKNA